MSGPRVLQAQDPRVEDGAVQFGDDWPGTFIRGDSAAHYAHILGEFLNGADVHAQPIWMLSLSHLRDLLVDSRVMEPSGLPQASTMWRTRSGALVYERDRKTDERGVVKIACYNGPRGGFRGWLRLDRLRRV